MRHIEHAIERVRGVFSLKNGERPPRLPQLERYCGKVALVSGDSVSGHNDIQQAHARQTAQALGRVAKQADISIIRVQALVPETLEPDAPSMVVKNAKRIVDALDAQGGVAVDYFDQPAQLQMGPYHVQNGHASLEQALTDFKHADEAQGGPQMLVAVANPDAAENAFHHVHAPSLVAGQVLVLQTVRDNPEDSLWTPASWRPAAHSATHPS